MPDEDLTFNRATTQITGGVAVGLIAIQSSSFMVIPSLNLGLAGARYDFNFSDNTTESGSDHYGLARLAVGIVIGRRLSIVPSVDFRWRRLRWQRRRLGCRSPSASADGDGSSCRFRRRNAMMTGSSETKTMPIVTDEKICSLMTGTLPNA